MEQVRSFIAIELPNELKVGLSQLEAQLKSGKQPGVKWVNPYSIHLTLKFLGNIAAGRTNNQGDGGGCPGGISLPPRSQRPRGFPQFEASSGSLGRDKRGGR